MSSIAQAKLTLMTSLSAAHSDPDELRRAAEAARHGAATGDPDFLERQAKVQALLHRMKEEPSEAELMQVGLTHFGGRLGGGV